MRASATLALLALGGRVYAAFGMGLAPRCWKKCARDVGLTCGFGDIPCLCRAINDGHFSSATSCACDACSSEVANRVTSDWYGVQLQELSVACKLAMKPIDPNALESANRAASCFDNGNSDDDSPNFDSRIAPAKYPKAAIAQWFSQFVPAAQTSSVAYNSPVPKFPFSYPPLSAVPQRGTPFGGYPTSYPYEYSPLPEGPSPTTMVDSRTIQVPVVTGPSGSVSYTYATLTVPVVPVPHAQSSSPTSSVKSTSTAKSTASPTRSTGGAIHREIGSVEWAGSMLALGAVAVFGLA